jgi:hypothetical protein
MCAEKKRPDQPKDENSTEACSQFKQGTYTRSKSSSSLDRSLVSRKNELIVTNFNICKDGQSIDAG